MSIKVLVTKEIYQTREYGYGTYERVGTPVVAMHTVEFDTRKEAEAYKARNDDEPYRIDRSTEIEILN